MPPRARRESGCPCRSATTEGSQSKEEVPLHLCIISRLVGCQLWTPAGQHTRLRMANRSLIASRSFIYIFITKSEMLARLDLLHCTVLQTSKCKRRCFASQEHVWAVAVTFVAFGRYIHFSSLLWHSCIMFSRKSWLMCAPHLTHFQLIASIAEWRSTVAGKLPKCLYDASTCYHNMIISTEKASCRILLAT